MKPTTIVFLAFVAVPAFAHPVTVNGPTSAKNEGPVIEPRDPRVHIHINGKKLLSGLETGAKVALKIASFFRRDLDQRALFDKGYEISARRSLPDLDARNLEKREGHHRSTAHSVINGARIGLEVYDAFSNQNSKRDFDELEARDFDDELEARDFDEELEVRYFDDDLEARDFYDDYLDARALDEPLDELD